MFIKSYVGSEGSLGGSMDPLGGPMGPWDRWDLGTDGTWASRTLGLKDPRSTISIWISISIPGPARPGPGAGCRLPGRPFFGLFPPKKILKMHRDIPGIKKKSVKKITKDHKNYHFLFGPASS